VTIRAHVERDLTLARQPGDMAPAHVSAASGLVGAGDWLYVVVDDEVHLGVFPRAGAGPGRLVPLVGEELPTDATARKAAKPDFESLCLLPAHDGAPHGALLALGSGSAAARDRGARWALDGRGALHGEAEPVDLGPLYAALAAHVRELNVEGATVCGDALLLAQRGNSSESFNAIVALDLAGVLERLAAGRPLEGALVRSLERRELPEAGGVTTTFTDLATLPDGRVVFTACAEDTDDPYVDGAFCGAVVGVLDGADPRPLEPAAKVEGVWPHERDGRVELLLVADPDDRAIPAPLLAARLES
jgi:hypothetical protein